MPGQQCTYDAAGNLINGGAGAGTPDAYSPSVTYPGQGTLSYLDSGFSSNSHTFWDVNPFEASGMTWQEYQKTWTPNQGKNNVGACPFNIIP